MATAGIKTSLHEMRHAIIQELLRGNVIEIAVTERFNGYTRHGALRKPSKIKDFFVLIAPYVKRIQQFDWGRFMSEYGCLNDIPRCMTEITRAKELGKFEHVINTIDNVLTLNKDLLDECVAWFDRNGKGHPETMTRDMFLTHIQAHPLQGKEILLALYNELKPIW